MLLSTSSHHIVQQFGGENDHRRGVLAGDHGTNARKRVKHAHGGSRMLWPYMHDPAVRPIIPFLFVGQLVGHVSYAICYSQKRIGYAYGMP